MSDRAHDPVRPEGALFEIPERKAPELPLPERRRFTPLRAGILNLWQYDEQELRFHQGRLLLRGENGTGKSKALEVLLPFLLDADLSPNRLDPFAGTARTMYWNLLEGDRHDSRVGYVWIELGRLETGGEPVYWTIGCGLRATRRTRRVDSWYFVAPRRVGADLALLGPDRRPLLKEELKKVLGDGVGRPPDAPAGARGAVYDTGREYRDRVDHLFYSLGGDRFAALRHLLLQLRRPQLSQKLDPSSLSDLLAESLPPVDADLIGQLSEGFERLEEDERALAGVEAAARQLEEFLGVYRTYARGVARGRAAEVRGADSRYHKTAGETRDAEEARDALDDRLEELRERQDELARSVDRSRGALAALEQSEAMRSAEALRAKREHADDLERSAAEVARDRERAEAAGRERRGERDAARREAEETRRRRGEHLRETE
ncbi:MAG: TIGR02680 family protein, partial [Acidobacteriota bacterium]